MNKEQRAYIKIVNDSSPTEIYIKKTGWEGVNLDNHLHPKFQIIYMLSGTLRIQIGENNYFVPEKHIAWIPKGIEHKLSSNNKRISIVIFYCNLMFEPGDRRNNFYIYNTNAVISETLKFLATGNTIISIDESKDLYNYALGFLNFLPIMNKNLEFMFQAKVIPNDPRIRPVLKYIVEHSNEEITLASLAEKFGFSVRNLSRLLQGSGIRFNRYLNQQRIIRAIELFTDGGKTMQQIAFDVGFSTPNNFNRVFKQITGTSPGGFLRDK